MEKYTEGGKDGLTSKNNGRTTSKRTPPSQLKEAERRIKVAQKSGNHRLILKGLHLRELPCLDNLPELRILDLSDNFIEILPSNISDLRSLRQLDLSNNKLKHLPTSIEQLTSLKALYLHKNEELRIPPELLGTYYPTGVSLNRSGRVSPNVLFDHLFSTNRQRLNEAKLLLVGQGAVGKTSLVKLIVSGEKCDPSEAQTEGINIDEWYIPDPKKSKQENDQVRVNIWDFGGQEIMHATHQFFLTKRSLYLIVLDARKGEQEGNLNYWLKIIRGYCGNSPVIIVVNKHESPHYLDLNERRLLIDNPNIIGFHKVSCLTGIGGDNLRNEIINAIYNLPHVFDEIPKSYIATKKSLEAEAEEKDFIDISLYNKICFANEVFDKKDQDRLLRFLHDLGTVLNFDDPDDPYEMRDTNVLNPEWVTTGVYDILNNNNLMQLGGILDISSLCTVFKKTARYPKNRHKFIIDIMRKFELCFEFPESVGEKVLIPELLSRNEPDINWDKEESLLFEIHYDVLPSGLICRFIVRTHHSLTKRPTYWRSGVLLDINECKCLVRSDTNSGNIFVSILGPKVNRPHALAVIRDNFKAIHKTIPGINAREKIPLTRDPGVVVDYSHLTRLDSAGEISFLPEGAENTYQVRELLGVIDEQSKGTKVGGRKVQEQRLRRLLTEVSDTVDQNTLAEILNSHIEQIPSETQAVSVARKHFSRYGEMSKIPWWLVSLSVSCLAAMLVYIIPIVPQSWSLALLVSMIVFVFMISRNPKARYHRLAVNFGTIWLGLSVAPLLNIVANGPEFLVRLYSEGPNTTFHIVMGLLLGLLLILDWLERRPTVQQE